jgi:hypothetical protein
MSMKIRNGDRRGIHRDIPEMMYTPYGLESEGQGQVSSFGACEDVIKQASPSFSGIALGSKWCRMRSRGILALHTLPRWTKGPGGGRMRYVWSFAGEVGYAAERKSVLYFGKEKGRYSRVVVGLVVLRRETWRVKT